MNPCLPKNLSEKAAGFPETSYGATVVTLVLENGSRIPEVVLAWGREIVKIGIRVVNTESDLGFSLDEISDVLRNP